MCKVKQSWMVLSGLAICSKYAILLQSIRSHKLCNEITPSKFESTPENRHILTARHRTRMFVRQILWSKDHR
ncbi:hypothetical protein M433DRAFT_158051 [Acidomyces richmondensis BFW]|nr:MAG: hypothetical protein FE78DRAFT_88596 [Acidomyces sp. 'richmondensis']KYG42299.1 hypothetical protein M433DRAFT_158051 [Acidomyces richmondensis BFW]